MTTGADQPVEKPPEKTDAPGVDIGTAVLGWALPPVGVGVSAKVLSDYQSGGGPRSTLQRGVPTVTQTAPGSASFETSPASERMTGERKTSPADRAALALQNREEPQGGGGGFMSPGGWVPKSREMSQVGAVQIPPEVAGQFDAAGLYKARGAIGAAAANTGAARAESENANQREQIQTQSLQQQERMDQGRARVVGARRKILDELNQDILDDKIDPRRFWTEKSTGEKVFLGIMAGIAGIGVGLSGGENPVLQNIRRNIELTNQEDLRRHQAKEKGYARQENALTGLTKIFDDERSALTALTSLKLSALEQALLKRKAVAKTALERANLDTVIGGIVEENAKTKLELEKLEAGKIGQEYKEAYAPPKLVGGGGKTKRLADPEVTKYLDEQYKVRGLSGLENALTQLGESMGLDGGLFAETAQYRPGQMNALMARASVKDPAKLQHAMAAYSIYLRANGGKALTDSEIANTAQAYSTASPEQRAVTAQMWGDEFQRGEAGLEAVAERFKEPGGVNPYQLYQFERRAVLRGGRPSVSAAGGEPQKGPKAAHGR